LGHVYFVKLLDYTVIFRHFMLVAFIQLCSSRTAKLMTLEMSLGCLSFLWAT